MHILRSTYLPAYLSMVKQPYTSDPFPLSSPSQSSITPHLASPVNSLQRETQVLDLFLAAKVRDDVWADESELHLEVRLIALESRASAYGNLFSAMKHSKMFSISCSQERVLKISSAPMVCPQG